MTVPMPKHLPRASHILVTKAVSRNTALKAAQSALAAADYERDASRSKGLPRISLEGRASHGQNQNGLPGVQNDAYVGVQLQWNLFDGGIARSETAALSARREKIALERSDLARQVTQNAENAWTAFVQQRKRSAVLGQQVNANRRIVRNYLQEYELSKRSLLDVLDAERALFNTRFQHISVQAGHQFAAYRMLAAQSALSDHFGVASSARVAKPNFETQARSSQNVFNIEIEPLK